jgi:hypothetical protein
MIRRLFHEHPAAVGETYSMHMIQAFRFGGRLIVAGMACFLHGLFPALFVRTGSRTVASLYESMMARRGAPSLRAADQRSEGSACEP